MKSVHDYVAEYEFRGNIHDYTPPAEIRIVIEDAIEGYLAENGESERVSELLRFNNEFEERARVAERKVKAMATVLAESERFMAYFAGETRFRFVGPGTPVTHLAQIRAVLNGGS